VDRLHLLSPAVCLCLAGCANIPDTYAPPVQRQPLTAPEPSPIGAFVKMSDANAEAHFVRDISRSLEGETWRWTGQRPELMFRLPSTGHLLFTADFSVPEVTFRQRGPVTISIYINNHLLDRSRYEKGGAFHLEKLVPSGWLRTDMNNFVRMEIDRLWVSPDDGARLGFILTSAGFR